ncbi:serine hydrolase domain-containing protein [Hufsiella ginkgonis]|uniref:Serine hydrolase n=1 Tax=Hufsiella ginkgonis TaxID=2695274 RepID=A0A7K1Y0L8_9SPHI|nr:serine hydrolase domain-containing protein [Hufsiella ginkgonis]MXV16775.1 serine hydrolase [Hufsiella ginkgonis]
MKFLCSLLVLTLAAAQFAYPQDKTNDIDKIFSWATPATPGCACAISQNGNVLANRFYGSADLERGVAINAATTFDIGSTRKQFIAATILLLVQDKKLSLSDDVHKYLPELPDYGHKITIDHLLTHTSGIRDWTGLLPLAGGDPTALSLILRQRSVNFAPGEEWSYSNSGFVLLTEIAERATRTPFPELIRLRVFEPLGMTATTYVSDMQQVIPNRALGYARDGGSWKVNMYLGNDRGGGAIFSNVTDLLTWNDALTSGRIGAFVTEKLQEPATLNNGRKLGYARGLALDPYRDTKLVWHSGGAAGYHTWIGRIPSQGLSIAITCNSDAMSATSVANRLLALYAKSSAAPVAEDGPPPTLTGEALAEANQYAGLYFNEKTGDAITLAVDRDRFRVAGGPGLALISKGRFRRWANSVFFLSQDRFELNFLSANQFELKSMEGKSTRYRRAQAPALSEADLRSFAGHYQSDELGAFLEIVPGNGVLVARLNDSPGNNPECKPVDRDTFQVAGIFFRFTRDKTGRVTGLNFSNPVVSNIKFSKVK